MAKRKDKDAQNNSNLNESNNAEDNFGLPEIEYKPLETSTPAEETQPVAQEETPVAEETQTQTSSYSYKEEETKSNAPVIIAVVIGLVLVVAAFLIYQYVYKPQAEKEKRELAEKAAADKKKAEAARLAREQEEAERKRLADEAAAAAAKPTVGTVETLSSRTGRYYVVIASAVDGDLILDYANKLAPTGVSTKIIPPFGKWKFYRLTVGDYDTFATAQGNADTAKPQFGEGAWVLKY